MNIPLLRRGAQAGEQIRSNGIISRLGEPAAHVPNPFMLAEYLVYDDQDRRVIVSLGTRPKAWQRKIAARNHNVFLVQSFAIRLFRSGGHRSEEHTSELQSLMRISYAVSCLKKKTKTT